MRGVYYDVASNLYRQSHVKSVFLCDQEDATSLTRILIGGYLIVLDAIYIAINYLSKKQLLFFLFDLVKS